MTTYMLHRYVFRYLSFALSFQFHCDRLTWRLDCFGRSASAATLPSLTNRVSSLLLLYKNPLVKYSRKKNTPAVEDSSVCRESSLPGGLRGVVSLRGPKPRTRRCPSSTTSCWSRTCSTAVHRTCGCRRRAGEPSGTSWSGPRSVPLQRHKQ